MKKGDKLVTEITARDEDFARWYTDIVKKAELVDYSSVRGCCVLRPYGYAIWEHIQRILDAEFKRLGHENVMMPMFIPESLLQRERDHVEGFAPEVAWVTHGGDEELAERLCVRPTSEVLFCDHYANIIESWRDLPKLYNQWCSVVRWEKSTRPFLRTAEFLWQEGHTMHETAEEAIEETERMLNVYADFAEGQLAMPVLRGEKTDREKFAGAERTYTIEAMMHDGKALQSGTSHYFGDGFARAFNIQFTDRNNQLAYPHQTSWGLSTRIIGGIIMTHGDDSGLVLPPAVAPIQVVILPIAFHRGGVLEKAREVQAQLRAAGLRVKLDDGDASPGWKFAEYEMKGIPLRVEIGPRDLEQGSCIVVPRDNREKTSVPLDRLAEMLPQMLGDYRLRLYARALQNREKNTFTALTMEEILAFAAAGNGFLKTMWCKEAACEERMKEQAGLTSRCMPLAQEQLGECCPICQKPAKVMVVWGRAY